MKKFTALLLCCCIFLSLTVPAFAVTDFTFRDGIRFGDTMEQVMQKETTLTLDNNGSNRCTYTGTVAGYPGTACAFWFDEETGGLVDIQYMLGSASLTSKAATIEAYGKLFDGLQHKYGQPEAEGITGRGFETFTSLGKSMAGLGTESDKIDYSAWILETPEGEVIIDLMSYYFYFPAKKSYLYYVVVGYRLDSQSDDNTLLDAVL